MSWELLQAVLLSLLPAAFWLWYVASSAPKRSNPRLLAAALLAGALSPLGVIGISVALEAGGLRSPSTAAGLLVYLLGAVGLVEELCKLLAVRLTVYRHRDFQEPWDGLLYSCAAALGFATSENVKYVLGYGSPTILVGRSLLSTFGHVLMSAWWGYALGRQKRASGWGFLTLEGLTMAALAHGVYDWLLFMEEPIAAVAVLALLWWVFRIRIGESVLGSRHYQPAAWAVRECPKCHSLVRRGCAFCTACAHSLPEARAIHCGSCLERVDEGQRTCSKCRCQLV